MYYAASCADLERIAELCCPSSSGCAHPEYAGAGWYHCNDAGEGCFYADSCDTFTASIKAPCASGYSGPFATFADCQASIAGGG